MTPLPELFRSADHDRADATPMFLLTEGDAADHLAGLPEEVRTAAKLSKFRGEIGGLLPTAEGVLVGLGKDDEPLALGQAAASLPPGLFFIANPKSRPDPQMDALAWGMGAYRFHKYKTGSTPPTLILDGDVNETALRPRVEAVWLARDLVNTPAEDMDPAALEAAARDLAATHKADITVTAGDALAQGFPLIHAVGRAAAIGPRLIDIRWGPQNAPMVTLVGKGVCFDSGGLNIKDGRSMALMKKDMGGAANTLALAHMVMAAALPVRLRVLIPAVENAISGNAFRPGDVFTARSGKTVEISNTDAEGRLILADALTLAAEEKPARVISLATLTGAARVALGPDLVPLYTTDPAFGDSVVRHGTAQADPVWPMPLWQRYMDYLKSDIADINHAATTGFAGSITAALFLSDFVPEDVPYCHFDLYAWTPSARPGRPKGGEAMTIRALYGAIEEELRR